MTQKYYKFECEYENHDGEWCDGYYICEVIDGVTTRQIIELESELYWSTLDAEKDELFFFTDQPDFTDGDVDDARENLGLVELFEQEFNELWSRSGAN
jgi:hypothetical protein